MCGANPHPQSYKNQKKEVTSMGKNHSKKKQRTEYAKWESVMAKLDNQLKTEAEARKKGKNN